MEWHHSGFVGYRGGVAPLWISGLSGFSAAVYLLWRFILFLLVSEGNSGLVCGLVFEAQPQPLRLRLGLNSDSLG